MSIDEKIEMLRRETERQRRAGVILSSALDDIRRRLDEIELRLEELPLS